ncbi:MAG TPA: tetratricopeptide repeat protein [Thermoanaerobaculia bacterium]|nr:tetratricopeptide repeat protein [Thermoanaerobaculia bacterium]
MAVKREQVMQNAERFVARGRIDAAIREYHKVLADNPDDANTLNRIGDLYARVDKVDDAIGLYRRIAQRYTDDGFFVKAIAIYKKILKLDPTQLEVYERLAGLYHRQGLLNEARGQYQVLVDYYLKHENLASAINIQARMAELEPDNPTHHLRLAELYRQEGLTAKTIREYGKIAELMLEHGHAEEATKVLLRAVEVDPTDLDFLREAVQQLQDAGATGLAAHLLAVAVSKNPAARELAPELGQSAPAVEDVVEEEEPIAAQPEPPASPDESSSTTHAGGDELAPPEAPALGEPPAPPRMTEPAPVPPPSEQGRGAQAGVQPGAGEEEAEFSLDDTTTVFELDVDSLEDEIADFAEVQEAPPGESEAPTGQALAAAPQPAAEDPAHDIDWTFVGDDLDLAELPLTAEAPAAGAEEVEKEAPAAAAEESEEEVVATPEEALEIDQDSLAQAAAEIEPRREVQASDLVAEAQVLAKYGLEDKALERLKRALDKEPGNAEALAEATVLYLKRGQLSRAASTASELAQSATSEGGARYWESTRGQLLAAGFKVSGDKVRPPAKRRSEEQEVDRLLAGLMAETGTPREAKRKEQDEVAPAPAESPEAEALSWDGARLEPAAPPAAPSPDGLSPAPPTTEARARDESVEDVDWLDELAPEGASRGTERESLFASEEKFFDLAAEIEQELADEDLEEIVPSGPPDEPSLDEIVEGFKRGVAQSLSPEDFDTHFNLGIAYREMGLLDEAIGEFQLAAKDPRYLVDCCSMLGASFVDKGLPELAIKWYQRALDSPIVTEEATLGLLYEKGNVEMGSGMLAEAYKTFVDLYGMNSNYRDVVAKIQELKDKV